MQGQVSHVKSREILSRLLYIAWPYSQGLKTFSFSEETLVERHGNWSDNTAISYSPMNRIFPTKSIAVLNFYHGLTWACHRKYLILRYLAVMLVASPSLLTLVQALWWTPKSFGYLPWHIAELKMDLMLSGGGRWRGETFTLGLPAEWLRRSAVQGQGVGLTFPVTLPAHHTESSSGSGQELNQQAAQRPIHPGWSGHLSCETSLSKVCDFSLCNYSLASSQVAF